MVCLAAGGLSARADNGSAKFAVCLKDGTSKVFNLADIEKVTFGDDSFTVIATGVAPETLVYGDVRNIKFGEGPVGIGGVAGEKEPLRLFFRDGRIGAVGWPDGKTAPASVCDTGGRLVLLLESWDGSPVDVGGLSAGVYLFKVGNQTIKFMKER